VNPRITAVVVGLVIVILGAAGLFYPERVMGLLGFAVLNPSHAAGALGEIRATYGGLFLVMGAYTVLAAMDPAANRDRLLFVGLLWLSACAARLFGVYVDGNPGVPGWLSVVFELAMGGALVAAAQTATTPATRFQSPAPPSQPAEPPHQDPPLPGVRPG
jgi:hypothetical protein